MNISLPDTLKEFVDEQVAQRGFATSSKYVRELAAGDIELAADHYVSEGAVDAALGFIDAVQKAFARIARHPAAGSARYADTLNLGAHMQDSAP